MIPCRTPRKMKTRGDVLVRGKYQILNTLLDLPFCKIYQLVILRNGQNRLLIDFNEGEAPAEFLEDTRLWLSVKNFPFPEISDMWREDPWVSLVVSDFLENPVENAFNIEQAENLENKVFSLLPELERFFEAVAEQRIDVSDPPGLLPRIFTTTRGNLRLIPLSLNYLFDRKGPPLPAVKRESRAVPPYRYVQAMGSLISFFLTKAFPQNNNLAAGSEELLQKDTARILERSLAGKIGNLRMFDKALLALPVERKLALEGKKTKKPLAGILEKLEPVAGFWEKLSGLSLKIFNALKSAGKFLAFLTYLVLSYYWEQGVKIYKILNGIYQEMRELSWEEIQEWFLKEMQRFFGDLLNLKTIIETKLPVNQRELLVFTQQMAFLLDAGITLRRAIEILYKQAVNIPLRIALSKVYSEVMKGAFLSDAMAQSPRVFSSLYVNMVLSGETGGKMHQALAQLSEYLRRQIEFIMRVKKALTYPLIVALASVGILATFVYFVLPKFLSVLSGLNVQFPLITRIVIKGTDLAHSPGPITFVILGAIVLFFPLQRLFTQVAGRQFIDRARMMIPMFGTMYKKLLVAQFCSTLAVLLDSGIPLLKALEVTGRASGNEYFIEVTKQMIEELRAGAHLDEVVQNLPFFPSLVSTMIQVGDKSGELSIMLVKTSQMYETEVDQIIERFLALLEPLIIAFMGGVVLVIILAIFLPIYSTLNQTTG